MDSNHSLFSTFKKLGEDIYLYPKFLTEEECAYITADLDSLIPEEWDIYSFFDNSSSVTKKTINRIESVAKKIKSFLPEGLDMNTGGSGVRMLKGEKWGVHYDSKDFERTVQDFPVYATVAYFNKFEGGEIYYPNQNITYKPNIGDLIIHGADENCSHGVKVVLSEKRYSYAAHIYRKNNNVN